MSEISKENVPAAVINTSTAVNFFDPKQFEIAQRMSKMFACSMLVPTTYQTKEIYKAKLMENAKLPADQQLTAQQIMGEAQMEAISNCMIAIDIAQRIGAAPLMVMQNLAIIYGRPSWSSKFLIATVNTCGRFEPLKFRFTEKGNLGKFNYTEYQKQWVNGTGGGRGYYKTEAVNKEFDGTKIQDIECVAYTTAKGSKDVLESSPISIRMAIDEGWYLKNGSKWRTMPKQMLMYRAASFWTSAYAPELSMGMRTVEENQDIIDITDAAEDVTDQVAREKDENANKETISFEAEPSNPADGNKSESNSSSGMKVDTETGEILNDKQEEAPAGPGY